MLVRRRLQWWKLTTKGFNKLKGITRSTLNHITMTKNAEFFVLYCPVLITYPERFRQFPNAERLVTLLEVTMSSNLVTQGERKEVGERDWTLNTWIQLSYINFVQSQAGDALSCFVCFFLLFFYNGCQWLEKKSGGKDIQSSMTFRTGRNVFVCPRRVTLSTCSSFPSALSARSIKRPGVKSRASAPSRHQDQGERQQINHVTANKKKTSLWKSFTMSTESVNTSVWCVGAVILLGVVNRWKVGLREGKKNSSWQDNRRWAAYKWKKKKKRETHTGVDTSQAAWLFQKHLI